MKHLGKLLAISLSLATISCSFVVRETRFELAEKTKVLADCIVDVSVDRSFPQSEVLLGGISYAPIVPLIIIDKPFDMLSNSSFSTVSVFFKFADSSFHFSVRPQNILLIVDSAEFVPSYAIKNYPKGDDPIILSLNDESHFFRQDLTGGFIYIGLTFPLDVYKYQHFKLDLSGFSLDEHAIMDSVFFIRSTRWEFQQY